MYTVVGTGHFSYSISPIPPPTVCHNSGGTSSYCPPLPGGIALSEETLSDHPLQQLSSCGKLKDKVNTVRSFKHLRQTDDIRMPNPA